MNKFYSIILLFFLISCNLINQSKENNQDEKLDESIDFSQVDSYPKFPDCHELLERKKEVSCFSAELNSFLDKAFKNNTTLLQKINTDKINLYMSIDQSGKLIIDSLKHNDQQNITNSHLIKSINKKTSALRIQPALKHGIPVKVNFKMPVNIEYED